MTTKRVLTPAGETARDQARVLRDSAERTFGWLVSDEPAGALARATTAGSIMLLSFTLYPDLGRLREQSFVGGDDALTDAAIPTGSDSGSEDRPDVDDLLGDAPKSRDSGALSIDFDALDGLVDISADIDAGVDAGSDGGGDGDGGDGGGD